MDEAINEYRRQALADCNGNQECIITRLTEIMEMRRILLEWRQAAINGELATEQEKENEWDEFIQKLPPTLRDLADALGKLIDLIRPSNIQMSGILTASNHLAITVPDTGSAQQSNPSQSVEPLTEPEAIDAGLSVIQQPIGIIPLYRTTLSGVVPAAVEIDDSTYSSQMDISLNIRWDGAFDATDQFTVESGSLELFESQAAIHFVVDSAVGASYGKFWSNGNGIIRLSGRVQFVDPLSNTIMFGDERIIALPIELLSDQQVAVETDGFISTSFMKPFVPNSISDYDGNGVVNSADETLFHSDIQNQIGWADLNGDTLFDQSDVDLFYAQYDNDLAHQDWLNTRMGN